jgi:hypothetical protein
MCYKRFYSVTKLKKTNISHFLTLDFKHFPTCTWIPYYCGHSVGGDGKILDGAHGRAFYKHNYLWHFVRRDIFLLNSDVWPVVLKSWIIVLGSALPSLTIYIFITGRHVVVSIATPSSILTSTSAYGWILLWFLFTPQFGNADGKYMQFVV